MGRLMSYPLYRELHSVNLKWSWNILAFVSLDNERTRQERFQIIKLQQTATEFMDNVKSLSIELSQKLNVKQSK